MFLTLALEDQEHIRRTREMVTRGKAFVAKELEILNLPYVSGEGNYTMIKLPMSDTLAYRKLMSHGVMVRTMTGFRFPNWVRVSIQTQEAMEAFMESLSKILPQAGGA